jgi:hypothetical protein
MPGALKRIAYNVAWLKIDPLWVAIIRAGLMPFATRIFERVLRLSTKAASPTGSALPLPTDAPADGPTLRPLAQPLRLTCSSAATNDSR